MTKRISCKVVRSVPLTKATNRPHPRPSSILYRPSPHERQRMRDEGSSLSRGQACPCEGRGTKDKDSVTYPGSLDISGVRHGRIDYRLTGQILDCYV